MATVPSSLMVGWVHGKFRTLAEASIVTVPSVEEIPESSERVTWDISLVLAMAMAMDTVSPEETKPMLEVVRPLTNAPVVALDVTSTAPTAVMVVPSRVVLALAWASP